MDTILGFSGLITTVVIILMLWRLDSIKNTAAKVGFERGYKSGQSDGLVSGLVSGLRHVEPLNKRITELENELDKRDIKNLISK